ncbi:DNA polymerase III subunit beta [Spiroplasma endosymbiont of Aspidapion aeneum]|uniref:DNA polymerase III subunit beta n=1 Tax=Spiroplasma endosymbiont of Aspidapion aeneum TaxID=3066276 RepID=UPI00313AFBE6
MQFNIDRNLFIEEINKANKIIDLKSQNIGYTYIKVSVEVDNIIIKSVNKNFSLKSVLKVGETLEVKSVGEFLIKGKQVIDILKKMNDNKVNIYLVEEDLLLITDEKSEFSVGTSETNIFVDKSFKQNGNHIVVKSDDLLKGIKQTIVAVNEQCTKVNLKGLNLTIDNGKFYLFATDNTRIAVREIDYIDSNLKEMSTTIPKDILSELLKVLDEKGDCKIINNENCINFIFGNVNAECGISEYKFPNLIKYTNIDYTTLLNVDHNQFTNLMWRADLTNDITKNNNVNFELSNSSIHLNSTAQNCTFKETFTGFEIEGEQYHSISFNARFMYDALKSFSVKNIQLKIKDKFSPIIVLSDEFPQLVHVVLPLIT